MDSLNSLGQALGSRRVYRNGADNLLELTLDHQGREASDPRDKIFAFVGMANSDSVPPNLVRYDLPVLQSMVDTASKLLQKTNSLEVLRYATSPLPGKEDFSGRHKDLRIAGISSPEPKPQDLPSWCPDWTQHIPFWITNWQEHRKERRGRFSAGTFHRANVVFHGDRVIHVGEWDQWTFDVANKRVFETLRQWSHMVANSRADHPARCDGCGKSMYGVRFTCQVCEKYDFCSRCMQNSPEPHAAGHNFSLIYRYSNSRAAKFKEDDWNGSIREANKRSTGLRSVPEIEAEEAGDGSFHLSGSSWKQLLQVDYPFTDGDSLQDAFRRTIFEDHLEQRAKDASLVEALSDLEAVPAFTNFWRVCVEGRDSTLRFDSVTEKIMVLIHDQLACTLDRRRMMVSRKGYIGLAPAGTRIGDHICVLHGGETPFILREWSTDGDSGPSAKTAENYTLIGEAYVHGLMRGEAITAADVGELQRVHMVLH